MNTILQYGNRYAIVRDGDIQRFHFISNQKRAAQVETDRRQAAHLALRDALIASVGEG